MTFDLGRSLRRIKPHRFDHPIRFRSRTELPVVAGPPTAGRELLLDTCVYIDVLQGRTPPEVDALLRVRTLNHLSACIAELTHLFGRLDPRHPETDAVLRQVARTVEDIPQHRLQTAGESVLIEAGILAGLVFRLCGLATGREGAALNDATLFLHGLATGQTILTRNRREFDVMSQVLPDADLLFYDRPD